MTYRPFFSSVTTLVCTLVLVFGTFVVQAGCGGEKAQPAEEDTAQEETQRPAEAPPADSPIALGQELYAQHCQPCHGPEGEGRGDLVGDLDTLPADLTQLASNNEGTYPVEEVVAVIDGRKELEVHETREMPIWGNIWTEDDGEPVPEAVAQERINALAEYIRTLQDTD